MSTLIPPFPAFSTDPSASSASTPSDRYLSAVLDWADRVLENCRDRYGPLHTPLFIDGIDTFTGQPAVWKFQNETWIISNFANHQHLLRTLVALTNLTGQTRYRDAAVAATRYMFDHYQDPSGLLYWGGHQLIDLASDSRKEGFDTPSHELKNTIPFYEFLWQIDPQATARLIRAIWNAHVLDWSNLDMNRHGRYGLAPVIPWNHEFHNPPPFFEGDGLTFLNAGTDLIYAGLILDELASEPPARTWALRMAQLYVQARHPATGLGAYQYSQTRRSRTPTDDDADNTSSAFGDRAQRQFGPEFGPIALEGNLIHAGNLNELYGNSPLVMLHLAERLSDRPTAQQLLDWTIAGLLAYARYGYDPAHDHLRPMWTDGTDLTGYVLQRDGYYGSAGTRLEARKHPFPTTLFLAYARAFRLSHHPELWPFLTHIARGHRLGTWPTNPASTPSVNLETPASHPEVLWAVLEIYRATSQPAYLDLARKIADNLLAQRYHRGYFLPSPNHIFARTDALEPLALLTLYALEHNRLQDVPPYLGGRAYIHGRYDGFGRVKDNEVIYSQKKTP